MIEYISIEVDSDSGRATVQSQGIIWLDYNGASLSSTPALQRTPELRDALVAARNDAVALAVRTALLKLWRESRPV